jgi:acetyl/propionyl-CoA carboxylase alpha subunit
VAELTAVAFRALLSGREILVEITGRRPQLDVRIDGIVHRVSDAQSLNALSPDGAFELTVDGTPYVGWRCVVGNDVYIRLGGRTFILSRAMDASATASGASSQHETRADMPGVVVAVHCEAGQAVSRGDKLVTIESMKLQATLTASHEAVVERVHVSAESTFERGALLVSFASASAT